MKFEDIVQLMLAYGDEGVTVREAQNELGISAKNARELLQQFGKPHVYKGTGISYVVKNDEKTRAQINIFNCSKNHLEPIRTQILEWLHEGNVDIIAWANDSLKRPPSYFVKED